MICANVRVHVVNRTGEGEAEEVPGPPAPRASFASHNVHDDKSQDVCDRQTEGGFSGALSGLLCNRLKQPAGSSHNDHPG